MVYRISGYSTRVGATQDLAALDSTSLLAGAIARRESRRKDEPVTKQ